jgi:hypothetical protein
MLIARTTVYHFRAIFVLFGTVLVTFLVSLHVILIETLQTCDQLCNGSGTWYIQGTTLAEKMSLLQDIDKKSESKGKLALKYGISNSSLSSSLKHRVKVEESFYKFKESTSCQHSRPAKYEELEGKLCEFFPSMCGECIGYRLIEKTKTLPDVTNIDDFKASNG